VNSTSFGDVELFFVYPYKVTKVVVDLQWPRRVRPLMLWPHT